MNTFLAGHSSSCNPSVSEAEPGGCFELKNKQGFRVKHQFQKAGREKEKKNSNSYQVAYMLYDSFVY